LKQLDKTVRQHEKQQAELAQKDGKRVATDRKTKALKSALEELHKEVKNAELFYRYITWLHVKFPKAKYEDVIGLCKVASPAEVIGEDYSLSPGRYVGVVIEEDGKTEEEFVSDLIRTQDEWERLNNQALSLAAVIKNNVLALVGE
jgi:type I restriction enzyme M protein